MSTSKTITLYTFDELSEDVQEKVIEMLSDINIDTNWWDFIFEDAKSIGLEITEFDIYPRSINGDLTEYLPDCCKLIRKYYGKHCELFEIGSQYLREYVQAFKGWEKSVDSEDYENYSHKEMFQQFSYSDEQDEVCKDFLKALLDAYLSTLCQQYEELTSVQQITETILAYEYTFTKDGRLS